MFQMEINHQFRHFFVVVTLSFGGFWTSNIKGAYGSGYNHKCITSRAELGECIELSQCPKLIAIIEEAKTNITSKEYLQGSVCEYVDNKPIICCPSDNPTDLGFETYDNFLSPPECGFSKHVEGARIVGGKASRIGDWPWEVALGYHSGFRRKKEISYHCGGALISDLFILTAAHCGGSSTLTLVSARMGVVNLQSTKESNPPAVDIDISSFITHEEYNDKQKYINDIALIKLAERVKFTEYIQPICLPKTVDFRINNFVNKTAYIAGWGTLGFKKKSSPEQMEIEVPILLSSVCHDAFSRFKLYITNKHLCAGDVIGEQDACQGDSGGPMMLHKDGVTFVLGVVSFGYRCAEVGFPGIYTKVPAYLDWISQHMN